MNRTLRGRGARLGFTNVKHNHEHADEHEPLQKYARMGSTPVTEEMH